MDCPPPKYLQVLRVCCIRVGARPSLRVDCARAATAESLMQLSWRVAAVGLSCYQTDFAYKMHGMRISLQDCLSPGRNATHSDHHSSYEAVVKSSRGHSVDNSNFQLEHGEGPLFIFIYPKPVHRLQDLIQCSLSVNVHPLLRLQFQCKSFLCAVVLLTNLFMFLSKVSSKVSPVSVYCQ